MNSIIQSVGYYIPKNKYTSEDIENIIAKNFNNIPLGIIKEMTGVEKRYFVSEGEYSSDLAIKASEIAIKKSGIGKEKIDLLIFASASQDIIEPATANIVQKGLGLHCPVFDIKNACNSFLNGIDIADSFIKSGKYKNILICSGETPSKVIKFDVKNREDFKKHFASYTFGDAGSALILSGTSEKKGILHSKFYSDGRDWDIATIMGGGSRYPQDSTKNFFIGDPGKIRDKFISIGSNDFDEGLVKIHWKKEDIKQVFVHQVAMSNCKILEKTLSIPYEKFSIILPEFGNIASCCIPTCFEKYCETHSLKKGDKLIFIGFASGFSYGVIYYEV